MAQVKHRDRTAQKLAATNSREFRTFLLMAQFEAQEIGARIQQARKERGLTQEDLAEMASFSKRSLQDYETGVTVPFKHLRELSSLLGRPVDWFLHGDDDQEAGSAEQLAQVLEAVEALRSEVHEVRELVEALREDPAPGRTAEPPLR